MKRTRNKQPGEQLSSMEESALSRWSRRKTLSRSEKEGTRNQHEAIPEVELDTAVTGRTTDDAPIATREFTDKDMPPVESLDENSDYAGFLSAGVSEKLRRAALRKLFHLEVFNVVDGLDDYAEDYTKFEKLGKIMTADLRLQNERAEQALKQKPDTETPTPVPEQEDELIISDADELEETEDLSDDLTDPGHEQNKKVN